MARFSWFLLVIAVLAGRLCWSANNEEVLPDIGTGIEAGPLLSIAQTEVSGRENQEALAKVRRYNGLLVMGEEAAAELFPEAEAFPTLGRRVGYWARRFLEQGRAEYRFGLAKGGYVEQGRLVLDDRQDCVSFMYRCTELARSASADEALLWALRTRFAGAPLSEVVAEDGAVDYDRPEHLDFSLDMVRTGIWGQDITPGLSGAVTDTVGSARYPAGSFQYVPGVALAEGELEEGDIVWLVLDPASEKGAALRQQYGLVIGHLGIVIKNGEETLLVHAAASDLKGCYKGGKIVSVPLATYLARVEKFAGVMVTRL